MKESRGRLNRTITLSDTERANLAPALSLASKPLTTEELDNRLFNQDLFQILQFLPDGFADLIIADPPYNLSKDFDGMRFRACSDGEYESYVRSWLPELMRLLKPSGSIYVCCDWKSSGVISDILEDCATVKNRITWQREKGRGAQRNWKNSMEDIWFAVKNPNDYYFDVEAVKLRRRVLAPYKKDGVPKDWEETSEGNYRMTHPSNLWDDITVPYWSMPENTDHPTQKPEKLAAKLILASCPERGLVFDPFLGSGTSAVVAKKLGRRYCGVELSREYALLAAKRLEMADSNPEIQGYRDGVFWERNSCVPPRKKG